jgi:hypothetical protein
MKSTNIDKISKSISCSNKKKLRFEDIDGSCNKSRTKKNFDDQCTGRESCILDDSLLGCTGYEFDLAYSCYDDNDDSDMISNSSISDLLTESRKHRLDRMSCGSNETQERSIIMNQENDSVLSTPDDISVDVEINNDNAEPFVQETINYTKSSWAYTKHWVIAAMILLIVVAAAIAAYMFFSKESNRVIEINLTPLTMMES